MARVANVSDGQIATAAWVNAFLADYLSQTDTTEQDLASNLNIGAKLLKTTNLAIKELDANTLAIRDDGDATYKYLIGNGLAATNKVDTNTIDEYTAGSGTTFTSPYGCTVQTETLGVGVTTLAITTNVVTLTGDGGGNNLATITGGIAGQTLIIICVDGFVTFVNDDGHGANTIDLVGAGNLVSADDTTLSLVFDGTSWYETSRSVN
jgi:hypothetical protein